MEQPAKITAKVITIFIENAIAGFGLFVGLYFGLKLL